jgi:hypothetical protein
MAPTILDKLYRDFGIRFDNYNKLSEYARAPDGILHMYERICAACPNDAFEFYLSSIIGRYIFLIHEAQILITGRIQFEYQNIQYSDFLLTKSTELKGSFYQPFTGDQVDATRTLQKCCCESFETSNKLKKQGDIDELSERKAILTDFRKGFCKDLSATMYKIIIERSKSFPDRLYGPIIKVHNTNIFELKVELKRKKGLSVAADLSFTSSEALLTFDGRFDSIVEDMFNLPYHIPSATNFDHGPIINDHIRELERATQAAEQNVQVQQLAAEEKKQKAKEKKQAAKLVKEKKTEDLRQATLEKNSLEQDVGSVFHQRPLTSRYFMMVLLFI